MVPVTWILNFIKTQLQKQEVLFRAAPVALIQTVLMEEEQLVISVSLLNIQTVDLLPPYHIFNGNLVLKLAVMIIFRSIHLQVQHMPQLMPV